MKIEPLVNQSNGTRNSSTLTSSNIGPAPEFEHLLEWARLGSAHVRKNMTCIKKHRQNLLASVETEKRLNELANWRESSAFSDQEKVALCLSEILSLHESEELSPLILEEARRHFSAQEIVRLALTIIAVNEWIDLQASSQAESAEVFTQDEIARQREDDLAETHFTVAAREEAEVNEGGPDDPTASSR